MRSSKGITFGAHAGIGAALKVEAFTLFSLRPQYKGERIASLSTIAETPV